MASSNQVEWCDNYKSNKCHNIQCTKVHDYKYCIEFENKMICNKENCRYLHLTKAVRVMYQRGIPDILKLVQLEAIKKGQLNGVCIKFATTGRCTTNCLYLHLDGDPRVIEMMTNRKCPICMEPLAELPAGLNALTDCMHCFCSACLSRIKWESLYHLTTGTIIGERFDCPVCRRSNGGYIPILES